MGLKEILGDENPILDQPLKPLWKCIATEFIGTVMLIFIGCGAGMKLSDNPGDARELSGVALCWALLIASLAQTLGPYSADLNPAITLAMFTTRKVSLVRAILYCITECVGCTAGAFLLKVLMHEDMKGDFSVTKLGGETGVWRGLVIEIVITAFLVLVICSAHDEGRKDLQGSIPLSIGFCIGSIILFAAPFTGASMNPARSLGPSIAANYWDDHWVFWVGPIVGAQIGAHTYEWIFRVQYPPGSKVPHTV